MFHPLRVAVQARGLAHISLQGACLAMLLFGSAAGDARPGRAPTAALPVAPPQLIAEPPVAATVALVPDLALAGFARLDPGREVERVIAGPLRCELTASGIRFAEDRFAFSIMGATRVGAGWLFIAADGAVARADSFLGRLQPLGHVPRATENMFGDFARSEGRLVFMTHDPHASLWTTDGSAPPAPARGAPPGVVLSAAFADAAHGMIVLEGGALFVTRDGAASFARVDLGDAAGAAVVAAAGVLYVTTSAGLRAFDRDGKVLDAAQTPAAIPAGARVVNGTTDDASDTAVGQRVFAAALRRYAELAVESWRGVIGPDGRALVAVGHALESLSGAPSGADVTTLQRYLPCSAARWGTDIALECFDGLFRADATTLRSTLVTAKATGTIALSGDGVHAAWPCDFVADGSSLCMLAGGQVTRHALGRDRLLGVRGDAAVVWQRAPGAAPIALIDAATGADRRAFVVRLPPAAAELGDEGWSLSADATTVTATAHAAGVPAAPSRAHHLVRVALSDGAVTLAPLPAGATRAGFVTAARGVAAGEDASTLWLTDDGGAHWQAHHGVSGVNRFITCRDGRCAIDGMVVVSFDRPILRADDRVIIAPDAPAAGPQPTRTAGLGCATHDVARPGGGREEPEGAELDASGRVRFQKPSADVTLHVTAGRWWDVAWRGHDERGTYTSRRAAGAVMPLGSDGDWYQLARATRDGVAIVRFGPTTEIGPMNQLVWLPAGGRPSEIDGPDLLPDGLEDILTLPGGALAVLRRVTVPDQPNDTYYRLVLAGPDGTVRARRTYYWQWDRNAAIGVSGGAVGVAWADTDPTAPRWFLPIDAAVASRELPAFDLAATPICTTAARGAAASIRVEGPARQDWQPSTGKAFVRVHVRDEPAACIQAIEARQPVLAGSDVFVTASPRGELGTTLDLRALGTRRTLRCGLGIGDPSSVGFGESVGAWTGSP